MNFLALLLPIFTSFFSNGKGGLLDTISGYFQKQEDIINAKIDLQKSIILAQQQMAAEMAKAQLEYQTTALQATTPIFKQHMFWFLSIPILYSLCFPSQAHLLWDNLNSIPEWYRTLYATLVLTIWGIPVAGNWIGTIFSGLTSRKIELKKVDKKTFYDALRTINGTISTNQVQVLDKVLDKIDNSVGS